MGKYWIVFSLILGTALLPGRTIHAQSTLSDSLSAPRDSHSHVYTVNYWVSGGIIVAGGAAGILSIPARSKSNITDSAINALNPNNVIPIDRWSLHQNPALVPQFETYSTILQITMGALPAALLFDSSIRYDWLSVMTMAVEVNAVAIAIYTVSPLGPLFQTQYRPIVYYNKTLYPNNPVDLNNGNNKNSFYSGHVASAAAASFFMAKVYCDYHPDADKWLVFGAAAIPPLAMCYVRLMALDHFPSDIAVGFAVGTLCGILIPELHHISGKDLSLGAYSSPQGAGLTLQWRPPEMALN